MGTTTPNISIYIPAAGETNYDAAFAAGMVNIDQHDHSGGPTKGVPIATSGLADGSVTYNKLNANVADNATGIGTAGSLGANQLSILGLLKSIFQIVTTAGFISKNGSGAFARTLQQTANQISISNPAGIAGDPVFSLPSTIYTNISFDSGNNVLNDYRNNTTISTLKFGGNSAGTQVTTGKYFKLGRLVFINIVCSLTTKSGINTGLATIDPLPFTSDNDGSFQVISMSGKINSYTAGSTALSAELDPNTNIVKLNSYGAANRAQLSDTNFSSGDELEISGFYWAST